MTATIHLGDCREIIATLDDNSIDAIVTDPPYELGFMGKKWDNTGIAYDVQLWTQCLRVLKPGGHLLAFGGTRTYHRMASAIEDAGFEVRDSIHWLYGSGFPKSHNLKGDYAGWGTALKPAHEPIVMARKPLVGTVAANVLEHGTGALNIDSARVAGSWTTWQAVAGKPIPPNKGGSIASPKAGFVSVEHEKGRWPANVITDGSIDAEWVRYFYCAKPSRAERNAGLDALEVRDRDEQSAWVRECGVCGCRFTDPNTGKPKCDHDDVKFTPPSPTKNFHPTVKPLALMRYLVRLVTPPGGTVLEPFAGSGTTLAAAILEGFNAIGCELTADYLPIIEGRIAWAQQQTEPDQESLFNQ